MRSSYSVTDATDIDIDALAAAQMRLRARYVILIMPLLFVELRELEAAMLRCCCQARCRRQRAREVFTARRYQR